MALTWTSVDDVKTRWLTGDVPASDDQLTVLLEDAEDTMLGEFADLQERIDDGLPIRRVRKVAARMVIRHLRNPDGVRSVQHAEGPYQESTTYGGNEPGALYMTEEDRAEIAGRRAGGAFTIDTIPQDYPGPLPPDPWEVLP